MSICYAVVVNFKSIASHKPNPDQLGLLLSQKPAAERTHRILYGVGEAGRGPLARPVTAAAIVLNPRKPIKGLIDSKILTAKKWEALYDEIVEKALTWHVTETTVEEINRINILHATMLAIQRVVHGMAVLDTLPDLVQVGGNRCPQVAFAVEAVVKGDALVLAISAASILAKVTRGRQLAALHVEFPLYGFDVRAGYGTPRRLAAIDLHDAAPYHRRSFVPVHHALGRMNAISIEATAAVSAWDD